MADQLSGDLVGDVASERPSGDAIGSMRLNTAHGTDVVIRQTLDRTACFSRISHRQAIDRNLWIKLVCDASTVAHVSGTQVLSLIHISEPTRLLSISYAVFCLKKKTK